MDITSRHLPARTHRLGERSGARASTSSTDAELRCRGGAPRSRRAPAPRPRRCRRPGRRCRRERHGLAGQRRPGADLLPAVAGADDEGVGPGRRRLAVLVLGGFVGAGQVQLGAPVDGVDDDGGVEDVLADLLHRLAAGAGSAGATTGRDRRSVRQRAAPSLSNMLADRDRTERGDQHDHGRGDAHRQPATPSLGSTYLPVQPRQQRVRDRSCSGGTAPPPRTPGRAGRACRPAPAPHAGRTRSRQGAARRRAGPPATARRGRTPRRGGRTRSRLMPPPPSPPAPAAGHAVRSACATSPCPPARRAAGTPPPRTPRGSSTRPARRGAPATAG